MRQFIVYRVSCIVKICVVISLLLITMNHELSTIYAASATLSIQPASGTFNIGCPFTLDVFLDTGGARTDGTDAILFYDQSRFTAQKIRPGTIYADYPGTVIDATKGRVAISGISSLSSAFAGQGILSLQLMRRLVRHRLLLILTRLIRVRPLIPMWRSKGQYRKF